MDIHSLSQQFCENARYFKGYSSHTIRRYRQVLGFCIASLRLKTLAEATPEKLRSLFYVGRTERHWKASTFQTYYKSLSVFFQWCIKEGYCQKNPLKEIEIPKLAKVLPPKLTRQEALRLLEVTHNYPYPHPFLRVRNHAIFATFIFAGLRRQEALNLTVSDINVENMSLLVRQGKGSKDRIVPICQALAIVLRKYIEERHRIGKTCPEFFTSHPYNSRFTDIGMKRLVIRMRHVSGIRFSVHTLRHTFATLMLEGGCDIYSLSRMMGHSDIKTTTIYLAASAEHLRSQMTKHPLNIL